MTRSLASLLDLSANDVQALAAMTNAAQGDCATARCARPLAGKVVAVLPFGASAESPAAWLAAAQRLGAGVLRSDDVSQGVSLTRADPFELAREAARWADLLVVSHPSAGFARAVGAMTGVSVLNAGESGGEDPVAGISLLAAATAGPPEGSGPHGSGSSVATHRLRAAICGDLWQSGSARGFLAALAVVEATILLVPARGRDLPEFEVRRLARRMGRNPHRFEAHAMKSLLDMVDTVLLAPEDSPQLPLFREVGVPPDLAARRARREVEDLDVLFVAAGGQSRDRIVREPFRGRSPKGPAGGAEHEVPRAAFEALLSWCANGPDDAANAPTDRAGREPPARYSSTLGMTCVDERCIAARHPDLVTPEFIVVANEPGRLECAYCGESADWTFAASKLERRYHGAGTPDAARILPTNLVLFRDRAEALASGFSPRRRRGSAGAAEDSRDAGAFDDDSEPEPPEGASA